MRLIDTNPTHGLGLAIAGQLGLPLAGLTASRMQHRDLAVVASAGMSQPLPALPWPGEEVVLITPLDPGQGRSVNDLLLRLLTTLSHFRAAGAGRIIAVIPWLPYARKDRRTKPRDPVSSAHVAQMIEAMGADLVITVEAHNPVAFAHAFRCRHLHLSCNALFAAEVVARAGPAPLAVLSPDGGGIARAQDLQRAVEALCDRPVGFGFLEKHRSGGVVSGSLFAADVAGCDVWIVDDMIETGETMLRAAQACRAQQARSVHLLATHAFFSADFPARLAASGVDSLTVTDTVAMPDAGPDEVARTPACLSVAPLIAQCLEREMAYCSRPGAPMRGAMASI